MKIYSISELAEIAETNKANVRRFIARNNLPEHNPKARKHANSPKYYTKAVMEQVRDHYKASDTPKQDSSTTKHNESDTAVIELLREQLTKAEQEKEHLLKLLDQQQQLTLMANKQLETIQIELKENEDIEAEEDIKAPENDIKDKETLFNRIFKRNK